LIGITVLRHAKGRPRKENSNHQKCYSKENHRIENLHKTIAISAALSPWAQKSDKITAQYPMLQIWRFNQVFFNIQKKTF